MVVGYFPVSRTVVVILARTVGTVCAAVRRCVFGRVSVASFCAELFGKRPAGHEEPGAAPLHIADSAEVRGHIEPVQTVGRQSQMELEGVRRIFPARRLREAAGFAGHRHLRSVQQHRAENPDR